MDDSQPDGYNGFAGKRVANLDKIIYRIIPEASTAASALQAGSVDMATILPVETRDRLVATGNYTDQTVKQFAKAVIVMNAGFGVTKDLNFRKAVQAAANSTEIMQVAYAGLYTLDPSFLFSNSAYYSAKNAAPYYNIGDVDLAKKYLAQSDYHGEKVVIMSRTQQDTQNMALVLQEQLQAAGINAEVNMTDGATFPARMMDGTGGWNIGVTGYGAQPLSGPAAYFPILKAHSHMGDQPEFAELTARWLKEPDVQKRAEIWQQIEQFMLENAYYVLGGDRGQVQVSTARLKNFVPFYSMRFWDTWLEK